MHRPNCLLRLSAALLLLLGSVSGLSSSKFRFKLNQLYEVNIGLENLRGTPLAFGDFSGQNDQLVDLFVATPDQKTVQLWEWRRGTKEFVHLDSADIKVASGFSVSNVIPGDYDMDGKLDVLVQSTSSKTKEVKMQLFLGDASKGFKEYGQLESANDALPFAFDYDGSGRISLLGGVPWTQREDSSAPPTWVWTTASPAPANATAPAPPPTLLALAPMGLPSSDAKTKMCQPASPHSSAFVDLDGDCRADLFIVCQGNEEYQIWTSSKAGFIYSQTGRLPSGAGPVSFADMNGDGSLDMVVPIVGKSQIHILYNEQRPLCIGAAARNKQAGECREFERICEADKQFKFTPPVDSQVIDVASLWAGETLLASVTDFQGQAPPAVRLGDMDLDGFPDMAFVTKRGNGETRVRLVRSVSCKTGECKVGSRKQLDGRSYVAVADGVAALEQVGGAQDVSFFDVDGTGTLALLVYYRDGKGQKRVTAMFNNFFTDAFFIKALACPHLSGKSCVGGIPGPAFKYVLVTDSGKKHVAQSAQAPQTAYRALFTPYTVIGIGRTNNYIEDFSVGSPGFLGHHERSFEGLIPNSRVVVFPVNSTEDWRLELYMNRSESTPYILATLLSSMAILAITVFVLGKLERKADQREKQRALHAINFDAL
ncbi:hypothetical protein H4S04_000078 [Coemansia sp. S16]|nr:hypothetical protein H4S03_000101 [Coemansia sp. S3946]KAJ2054322.1 hypothetical protein H4S04_000078 [Coemansia sp. S16]